jgi:hypothetical protein
MRSIPIAMQVGLDRLQSPLAHRNRAVFAAIVVRDAARRG